MRAKSTSPSTGKTYGLKTVCAAWGIGRSTIYAQKRTLSASTIKQRRGPKPKMSDEKVLMEIRRDLNESPFHGEGHRKVHARLRHRKKVIVGRERVRRIMGESRLLSPYRCATGKEKAHDGTIVTDAPNVMWATDATKVMTVEDGWVWFFGIIEHWNAECLGWSLSTRGDRHIALDALKTAVKYQFGSTEKGAATGLKLRPDHGSQFKSHDYQQQMKYWGIVPSFSLVREPETNGVVERFHRTLKEQIVHGHVYQNLAEFREAVASFIELYNRQWIFEKLGYLSPLEARLKLEEHVG
jgi:putative transposase